MEKRGVTLSATVLIWVISTVFMVGVAYATFATKEYVQERIDKHSTEQREQFDRIEKKLDKIDQRLYEQQQNRGK